jgi:hypothetical protein
MATGVKRAAAPRASALANGTGAFDFPVGTIFFTVLMTKLTSQRFGIGSRSPTCVVITCLSAVFFHTCCSVEAKFSTTTMALAPESCNWCSSSFGVYSGLTLTTVIPARRMPNSATGYCSRFGDMIATRSPLAMPGSPAGRRRNRATVCPTRRSSAYGPDCGKPGGRHTCRRCRRAIPESSGNGRRRCRRERRRVVVQPDSVGHRLLLVSLDCCCSALCRRCVRAPSTADFRGVR